MLTVLFRLYYTVGTNHGNADLAHGQASGLMRTVQQFFVEVGAHFKALHEALQS